VSTERLVQTIKDRQAVPIMDVVWKRAAAAAGGGALEAVPRADIPEARQRRAAIRLRSMRNRGFRIVPPEALGLL
jgi:hypothetical protein